MEVQVGIFKKENVKALVGAFSGIVKLDSSNFRLYRVCVDRNTSHQKRILASNLKDLMKKGIQFSD